MTRTKKLASVTAKPQKRSLKLPLIMAGVFAGLFFVCFFTYRFLFPPEGSSPVESPLPELTAEEQLSAAIAEAEQARKESVQDSPVTVYAGEEELSALYSGTLYNGVPYGTGFYKFSTPWAWTFSGSLTNGCISTGQVTDYPFAFALEEESASSKYTGNLVGGMPKGEGTFEVTSGEDVITLQGHYDADKSFSGIVTNFPLTFGYNGFVFEGRYTGALLSNLPEGEGHYTCEGEQYYSYSGLWSGGSPVGPGELSTNCASFSADDGTSFLAVYHGGIEDSQFSGQGEMTIGSESTGGYFYSGTFDDGAFSGQGKLVCYNPSGSGFTYEGGFSAGVYDGRGSLIFDNQDVIHYVGNFENGSFRPTLPDLLTALCSTGGSAFELTDQVMDFVTSHQEGLLSRRTDDLYFGSGFSYDKYSQSPENPDDRCFKTSVKLVQVTEYDESSFGFPVTELLGFSSGGLYVYYGYYFGTLPNVESGDTVKITAYPLGFSAYKDVSGNSIPSVRFVAFDVSR